MILTEEVGSDEISAEKRFRTSIRRNWENHATNFLKLFFPRKLRGSRAANRRRGFSGEARHLPQRARGDITTERVSNIWPAECRWQAPRDQQNFGPTIWL